jgi:hypothetical protein
VSSPDATGNADRTWSWINLLRKSIILRQGETLEGLQENLKDLYEELTSGKIPGVRRVAELRIARSGLT